MKKIIALIFLMISTGCMTISAQDISNIPTANDSTKATTLPDSIKLGEVVVNAKSGWLENGKAVFIPTKQARNVARDINSLIKAMNTGLLIVVNDKITTSSGEPVTVFINGNASDRIDKATFWAKNVLKVEYLPASDDPKYQGKNNVINIVMKEYISGGLTRIAGDQSFPNNGDYTAASKLVTRRMTFNAMFNDRYECDRLSGSNTDENFSNIWFDNTPHENVRREERNNSKSKNNAIFGGINARYIGTKLTATHSFGFNWSRNPGSITWGNVNYLPEIINANELKHVQSSKNYSYAFNGKYIYQLDQKSTLVGNWSYTTGRNESLSNYSENNFTDIITDVNENVHRGTFSLAYGRRINKKVYFSMTLSDNFESFSTSYSGSCSSHQKQFTNMLEIIPYLYFKPIESLTIKTYPSLSVYYRGMNDNTHYLQYMPGLTLNADYTINSKNSLSLQTNYSYSPPRPSLTSDLILQETELKWLEGSPSLKAPTNYGLSLNYFVMPTYWFNLSASGSYTLSTNNTGILYRAGDENYNGVIGQYVNGLNQNDYTLNCTMSFRPFRGKLMLLASAYYSGTCVTHVNSVTSFTPRLSANWFIGNWSIGTSAVGGTKLLANCGTETVKTDWTYDIDANYGNGNINFGIEIANIFNKYRFFTTNLNSGAYSTASREWHRGRYVKLSFSYTFDYGKKVDRRIDISNSSNNNTAILGK